MKLGVVGKGGTGKTTLSTLVALAYVGRGKRVVAVDTDSNPNLALSLGLDEAVADQAPLVPRALVVGSGDGALTPHQLLADYGVRKPQHQSRLWGDGAPRPYRAYARAAGGAVEVVEVPGPDNPRLVDSGSGLHCGTTVLTTLGLPRDQFLRAVADHFETARSDACLFGAGVPRSCKRL